MSRLEALELGEWRANAENTLWLLVALVAVVVPHMGRFPIWVSVGFIALTVWRWLYVRYGRWQPGKWLRIALAIAVSAAIALQFRSLLERDAGVALLALLAGLKLLETHAPRDAYVTLMLVFFLSITNFLYSQSIVIGAYMLLVTVITTTALVSLQHSNDEVPARARLSIATRLFAQALPLMLVAFVLFPRLPGPLWGLPKDAHSGVTGLSESMSPGQISSLSQSNAVAFRVKFNGPTPDSSKLYWRGPVLDRTNGVRWTRDDKRLPATPGFLTQSIAQPIDYTVTLEPTFQRWLFALEMSTTGVPDASLNLAGEILASDPVNQIRQYSTRSYLSFLYRQTSQRELAVAQMLPDIFHPRARRLAAQWRDRFREPDAIVAHALAYFREQNFAYTLQPPRLEGDSVDEFLFLTKQGFCEHFASAFVVLMRAAGISARVVTGYQGGEANNVGDYWIVRQRDAHAWAEIWSDNAGWVRVDPTGAVSPARVSGGVDVALPASSADALFGVTPTQQVASWWRHVRHSWDAINNGWNQWILGYGRDTQRNFLAHFGLDARSWKQIGVAFVSAMGIVLGMVALLLWRRREPVDKVTRAYAKFCARLHQRGVTRALSEAPCDFAHRAGASLPQFADEIREITALYERARYARAQQQADSAIVAAVSKMRL